MESRDSTYWGLIWKKFHARLLGRAAWYVVVAFCLVGIYAPFLAASKPMVVEYQGEWYFPLFRYLFYRGYYTKGLDLFFNLMIFTFPIGLLIAYAGRRRPRSAAAALAALLLVQLALFTYAMYGHVRNPAFDPVLSKEKQRLLASHVIPDWNVELAAMSPYERLNLALDYQRQLAQQKRLQKYAARYEEKYGGRSLFKGMPTLWQMQWDREENSIRREEEILKASPRDLRAQAAIKYIEDRRQWLKEQLPQFKYEVMPLVRPFHWEEDAGGDQSLNYFIPFWELTRINRKDLVAALIFGVRISLVVGLLAVGLALAIGLPVGSLAGFFGGTFDIVVSRLMEVWEGMPTFFMLLMVVAILQSKSIFLVIAVIGIFGWTTFSRYLRGEFFKQRHLPYTEACRAIGLPNRTIIFSHIFPNAIPPVLTLLPFAIMAAISSEAGLSFLGLGEEGSCSWGVLMDEGRTAFPGESYLLWPPAILLTTLLIAIALVGDALRDVLDPKMQH